LRGTGGAGAQDRAVCFARANAVRALWPQQVPAEAADRCLEIHAKQLRRLRIQVADVAIAVHREHAFHDPSQHALGFGFAPPQRACEIYKTATHVLHRARQRSDLGGTADGYRGGEVALPQSQRRRGEVLDGTGNKLPQHGARQYSHQRQQQRGDQQAMDQRADFAIDLRRRQARLEQRDGLAGIGVQREAGHVHIQRLDMRHRIMTVRKARTVDAGQLVHRGRRKAAVVDEPDR
jgi:hypothetical protein